MAVTFGYLNVECLNSKKSDIGFLTYLARFDFICLTETVAESIGFSPIEPKDFLFCGSGQKAVDERTAFWWDSRFSGKEV